MNRFKDTTFIVKFLTFIFLPSIILIYNAVNNFIYNLSFSEEVLKEIVDHNYIHPYISAFMIFFSTVVSIVLLFTSCFYEKTYGLRKILFIFLAIFYFALFVQNVVTYGNEWYHTYFKGNHNSTLVYTLGSLTIALFTKLFNLFKSFLTFKLFIAKKSANKFILFVAICAVLMQFANILLDILTRYEYSISLNVSLNYYLEIKYVIYSAICGYSNFCLIYFGFRNNSFVKGEVTVEKL